MGLTYSAGMVKVVFVGMIMDLVNSVEADVVGNVR